MVYKICAKIPMRVRDDTGKRLNQHYFGDIFTALDDTSTKEDMIRIMSGERTYDPDNLPCGAKPLNNYTPTSTLDGCTKIAQGDSVVSRADTFIHHIFKTGFLPKRMRRHVEPNQSSSVYVGLPVIELLLRRIGLPVKGTPETRCSHGYECSWDRKSGMWHLEMHRHRSKAKPVSDCNNANVNTSLVSANYYAHDLSGSSEVFSALSDGGESISAATVWEFMQDAIIKNLM